MHNYINVHTKMSNALNDYYSLDCGEILTSSYANAL